jgi:hypothetical protein
MPSTDRTTEATLALVQRVEAAFNRPDFDAVMAEMTADVVAERAAPVGTGVGRQVGQAGDAARAGDLWALLRLAVVVAEIAKGV